MKGDWLMKEAIITSTILIICIALLRKLCKGKISAVMQYSLWLIVAVRLILPVFTAVLPNLMPESEFSVINVTEKLEDGMNVQLSDRIHIGQINMNLPIVTNINTADGPTAVFVAGQIGYTWIDFFKGIWYIGIAAAAVWMLAVNILFMRRLHRERTKLEREDSKLPVYSVKGLTSPCLYGLPGKQAVYISEEILEDEEKVRHILAHEYCHYRHKDVFWAALRCVLAAVYWFNPFVWLAAVLSKQDCELACDEAAIRMLGEDERIAYGKTLLSLITRKTRASDIVCTATTMTSGGRGIKERIGLIAEKPHRIALAFIPVFVVLCLMVVSTFTKAKEDSEGLYISEGEKGQTVTTSCFQITFPEEVASKLYYKGENDTDVIIYHKKYEREIGRFRKLTLEEALELADEREITVIGDYGQNIALRNHIDGGDNGATETIEHYYYSEEGASDGGVPGTDSNESETTYIIDEDETTYIINENAAGNSKAYVESGGLNPIPAPENVERNLENMPYYENVDYTGAAVAPIEEKHDYTPNEESQDYLPNEVGASDDYTPSEESRDYLPNETIASSDSTIILPSETITVVGMPYQERGCYVYVPADNSDAEQDILEELSEINRQIADIAPSAIVLAISMDSMDEILEKLAANRSLYAGDIEKSSNVAELLPAPLGLRYSMLELQGEEKSYNMTIHYKLVADSIEDIDEDMLFMNAALAFASIEDINQCKVSIELTLSKEDYAEKAANLEDTRKMMTYEREAMEELFGPLYPASEDKDALTALYNRIAEYLNEQE